MRQILLTVFLFSFFAGCVTQQTLRVKESDPSESAVMNRILNDSRIKEEIAFCKRNAEKLSAGQRMDAFASGNFCERGEDGFLYLRVKTDPYKMRNMRSE